MNKTLNRILRSPDAIDASDPLDTPCNDIDTDFPLVPPSNYRLRCTKAEKQPGKRDQTRENLIVTLETTTEVISTKGEPVPAGLISFYKNVALSTTDKYDNRAIAKNVSAVAKGLGKGNLSPREIINDPSLLVGGEGEWKVKLRGETPEFSARNEVGDPVTR